MTRKLVSRLASRRNSGAVVFAALLVGVVAALLLASPRVAPRPGEMVRRDAAATVEDVVKGIAWYGPGQLRGRRSQAAFATFDGRGTLLVLGSAWSRLSLGRLGYLEPSTATRLPWLLLASLGPSLMWWVLRRTCGPSAALGGALFLVLVPGWFSGAVGAAWWPVVVSGWLLVVGLAGLRLAPSCRGLLIGGVLGFWVQVHVAVLLALGWLVAVHWWRRRGRRGDWGQTSLPLDVVVGGTVAVPVGWALNPALWSRSTPELVRWALGVALPAPSSPVLGVGWSVVAPAGLAVGGAVAVGAILQWFGSPRSG